LFVLLANENYKLKHLWNNQRKFIALGRRNWTKSMSKSLKVKNENLKIYVRKHMETRFVYMTTLNQNFSCRSGGQVQHLWNGTAIVIPCGKSLSLLSIFWAAKYVKILSNHSRLAEWRSVDPKLKTWTNVKQILAWSFLPLFFFYLFLLGCFVNSATDWPKMGCKVP